MFACIENNIHTLNSAQWDALNSDSNPFMSHAFLSGLETNNCVSEETGWYGQHIVIYNNKSKANIIAVMPCYLKMHSYGEYIFDWAWAEGYQRAGLEYYPKLSCAFPFTPVTAKRWLIAEHEDTKQLEKLLIEMLLDLAQKLNASSIHCLFTQEESQTVLKENGFIERSSSQFHWKNSTQGYKDFPDFLASMTSRKRKNIKKERQTVSDHGVYFQWFNGEALTPEVAKQMFAFYQSTIRYYGAQQYLTETFFDYIATNLTDSAHILLGFIDDKPIAGGLYFANDTHLYGRYWGTQVNIPCLHFETCYYQAIEYAIKLGLHTFEAGAQGEHKLARGLMPIKTHSMHWLADARFKEAVLDFTKSESLHVQHYNKTLSDSGPFRQANINESHSAKKNASISNMTTSDNENKNSVTDNDKNSAC